MKTYDITLPSGKNITAHVCNDEEFEALPYRDVEISLGLADTKTNQAFIRETGLKPVDYFTAAHELEHLMEGEHGTHSHASAYGDGVYHFKFLAPLLGALASAGGGLAAAAPALGGIGSALGAVSQARQMFQRPPSQSQPQMQQPPAFQGFQAGQGGPQVAGGQSAGQPNVVTTGAPGGTGGLGVAQGAIQKIRQQNQPDEDMINQSRAGFMSGRNPY